MLGVRHNYGREDRKEDRLDRWPFCAFMPLSCMQWGATEGYKQKQPIGSVL